MEKICDICKGYKFSNECYFCEINLQKKNCPNCKEKEPSKGGEKYIEYNLYVMYKKINKELPKNNLCFVCDLDSKEENCSKCGEKELLKNNLCIFCDLDLKKEETSSK